MNLENIVLVYKAETTVCSLQIVQRLPHIAISGENDCFKPFWNIGYLHIFKQSSFLNYLNIYFLEYKWKGKTYQLRVVKTVRELCTHDQSLINSTSAQKCFLVVHACEYAKKTNPNMGVHKTKQTKN